MLLICECLHCTHINNNRFLELFAHYHYIFLSIVFHFRISHRFCILPFYSNKYFYLKLNLLSGRYPNNFFHRDLEILGTVSSIFYNFIEILWIHLHYIHEHILDYLMKPSLVKYNPHIYFRQGCYQADILLSNWCIYMQAISVESRWSLFTFVLFFF